MPESTQPNVLAKKTELGCRNGTAAVGVVLGEPAESCLGPDKISFCSPPLSTRGLPDIFRCSMRDVDAVPAAAWTA